MNSKTCDFIKFKLDIGRDEELYFLLDTGADVSIIKSEKLIGSTEFESREKIKLKSVGGSIVETHGLVTAKVMEGNTAIPFTFQLVSKQVDINGDGIIGRDLLKKTAGENLLREQNFGVKRQNVQYSQNPTKQKPSRKKKRLEKGQVNEEVRTLTLPSRSETLVRITVESKENQTEGLIEKRELGEVFLASSLATVRDGYVITSVLNTTEQKVVIPEPKVKLELIEGSPVSAIETNKKIKDHGKEVVGKLRLQHLNSEERNTLENTCLDYQDIFHLPGDKLSCTNATQHSITLVPGTVPINTKPYRLPEAQKAEIEKQVTKLVNENIIEESSSLWNSPLLIVPKKVEK
jgi:hypothetical protein